ncbi:MAG: glycosyltransferase family 4 protein [Chitinophagaceae bacterium]|nr:glycosyltransferase family 4 protein [Chitinophagaceae bacterium]
MFPFVLVGKIYAKLHPLQQQYDYFFFCPSYSIGGGERVQGDIIEAVADKKIFIIFNRKSANDGSLHLHDRSHTTMYDISKYTDNKYLYFMNFVYRGVCAQYINQQKNKPVVFIAQSNFGYKVTPHINRSITITELIHMYTADFFWVWAPFIKFIDKRVLLGPSIKEKFKQAYKQNGIPEKYLDRITIIPNCLEYLPAQLIDKPKKDVIEIYYAGRGSAQKRIWIIVKIIEECRKQNLPVRFSLAGSFKNELPQSLIDDGTFIGEIKSGKPMQDLHAKMDMLLMTSAWEGFPMVIMEAMSFGVICNVCAVDEIPNYIVHQHTGLSIDEVNDEAKIIAQAIENIKWMIVNPEACVSIRNEAFQIAQCRFSRSRFNEAYRKLFEYTPN